VCAQKRPLDGLHLALKSYRAGAPIPDYLLIIDDDTYVDLGPVITKLRQEFPPEETNLLAGCYFTYMEDWISFSWPTGGFGSFLPKAAIERLMQPVHCNEVDEKGQVADPFSRLVCWRLQQNDLGEQQFFQDGMSVADLMHQFSAQQPFTNVANWSPTSGYCFHRYVLLIVVAAT